MGDPQDRQIGRDPAPDPRRCPWADADAASRRYHDDRWCKPVEDENELFALLILEGMQSGLSWRLVVNREPAIRRACDGLDPAVCAAYGPEDEERLLQADGIIKNHRKIHAIGSNARAFLRVQEEFGSFGAYLRIYTGGGIVDHRFETEDDFITRNACSELLSANLKKRGFSFVGPVIMYSYLQAIGAVNDHLLSCPWR